jgi:hypothetical protein
MSTPHGGYCRQLMERNDCFSQTGKGYQDNVQQTRAGGRITQRIHGGRLCTRVLTASSTTQPRTHNPPRQTLRNRSPSQQHTTLVRNNDTQSTHLSGRIRHDLCHQELDIQQARSHRQEDPDTCGVGVVDRPGASKRDEGGVGQHGGVRDDLYREDTDGMRGYK